VSASVPEPRRSSRDRPTDVSDANVADPATGADDPTSDEGRPDDDGALDADTADLPPLVDWTRTGRRLRRVALVLAALVLLGWVADGVLGAGGFRLRMLGELTGIALLLAIAAEIVVVGGAALAGMLRAGERGERLARADVSLIPPQLRRRR
jgi:hypothetical protein